MESPHVLLQSSTPRDGHSEEQCVQPGVVEAFSNATPGRDDYSLLVFRKSTDLRSKRVTLFLAHSPLHHKNIRHTSHQPLKQELQVIRTLRKQERKSPIFDCAHHIGDDKVCAPLIIDERGVDILYAN